MEKIEFTKEQIEKIAEDISVICFRRDPKNPDEYVLLEYPKVNVFNQSYVWKDPSFDYNHQKEVKQTYLSFEAEHTFGAKELFNPRLAEVIQAMPLDLIGKVNAFTIKHDGFTEDGSKHKSIVTPYLIGRKRKFFVPPLSAKEEKIQHPSSLTIGDLMGVLIDNFCHVSIDVIYYDGNLGTLFEGLLSDVPEEYLDKHFRPIEIIKDCEDKIHLIIN